MALLPNEELGLHYGPARVSWHWDALGILYTQLSTLVYENYMLFDDQRQRATADDHYGEPGHKSVAQRPYMGM